MNVCKNSPNCRLSQEILMDELWDEVWKSAFLTGDLSGGGSLDHTLSLYRPIEILHKPF